MSWLHFVLASLRCPYCLAWPQGAAIDRQGKGVSAGRHGLPLPVTRVRFCHPLQATCMPLRSLLGGTCGPQVAFASCADADAEAATQCSNRSLSFPDIAADILAAAQAQVPIPAAETF